MKRFLENDQTHSFALGRCIENAMEGKGYVLMKNDPKKEGIIREFNIYLRENKKIILDADQLFLNRKYKILVSNIYLFEILKNPNKFVMYKPGYGWTTEHGVLETWQLTSSRNFKGYFTGLFIDQGCFWCPNKSIFYICGPCGIPMCLECFEYRRDYYFRYNNFFRCLNCNELNFF